MWTAKLKRVGGSIMVAIPPEVRALLSLGPNRSVSISVEKGNLVMKPRPGRIGLKARLEMSDFSLPPSDEELTWINMDAVGEERAGWGTAAPAARLTSRGRLALHKLHQKARKVARKSGKATRSKARGPR